MHAPAPRVHNVGLVHFALAMGGFAIGTTEFATMSLVPYMAEGLKIDVPSAGHVISAYALGVVVGAPLIAVAAAKLSRRLTLILLMTGFALFNTLSALAPDYRWLLLFRFLSGLPHGAYFGIAALVAASLVPVNKRSQAVGRMMLGLTVATILGVPLANWLGQALGWRWGFVVVGGLALATVALVAALVKTQGPQRFSEQILTNGSGFAGIDGVFRFKSDGANERGLAVLRVAPGGGQPVSPAPKGF